MRALEARKSGTNLVDRSAEIEDLGTEGKNFKPRSGWRAVAIGTVLVPVSVYFGNYAYVVTQALLWGQTSLLRGPVFVLFVLALINLALRPLNRRIGLSASEMIVIYSMIAIATCVSGFGMLQFLINMLPAGSYFANNINHYDRFIHLIPSFLVPHDPRVIQEFYIGHASFLDRAVLADWAVPVAVWSAFIVAMCWVTLCLSILISRPWIQSERLTFPLVELPLSMIRGAASERPTAKGFFDNKVMWAGFAVAGILESIDYLNYFYPSLPAIPIKPTHLETYFTTLPWNHMGMFAVAFYPFAISIGFLLSRDVSFSCWFFYLLTRLENVTAAAFGSGGAAIAQSGMKQPPYIPEQGVGAFVVFGVILLVRAYKQSRKNELREIPLDQAGSGLLSNRIASVGAAIGIAALTAFVNYIGVPLWASAAFWAIYLLIVIVLARIVSEAGAGWAWAPSVLVHGIITDFTGVKALSSKAITDFGLLSWFEMDFRDNPMPHQLEALKMRDEVATSRKALFWGLVIASILGTIAAFATYLDIYYSLGAASSKVRPALQVVGPNMLSHINNLLLYPGRPDRGAVTGMVIGSVAVSALVALRQIFVGWPFNPVGYVLSGTQSMDYMWCPFMIGWAIKSVTMRYSGAVGYGRLLPFFLGLILGDYIVPMLWGVFGMCAHVQVYMAFPH